MSTRNPSGCKACFSTLSHHHHSSALHLICSLPHPPPRGADRSEHNILGVSAVWTDPDLAQPPWSSPVDLQRDCWHRQQKLFLQAHVPLLSTQGRAMALSPLQWLQKESRTTDLGEGAKLKSEVGQSQFPFLVPAKSNYIYVSILFLFVKSSFTKYLWLHLAEAINIKLAITLKTLNKYQLSLTRSVFQKLLLTGINYNSLTQPFTNCPSYYILIHY